MKRLLFILVVLAASCTSVPLQSPEAGRRIILGTADSQCRQESTQKQWYILFGTVPLNHPSISFSDPSHAYRIVEERTWSDALITIVGGALLTVTRESLISEVCEEKLIVATAEQLEQKRKDEIRTALDGFLEKTEEPIFLLKSGERHRGKIQELSEEEVIISEQEAAETEPEKKTEKPVRIAKILMRDGSSLSGEILDQTPTVISLRTPRGKVTIQKGSIRRISYAEEERKQAEEPVMRRVALRRDDILRIVFAEDQK